MKKIVITLTTEADLMTVNINMNVMIAQLINAGISFKEYTIQEAK